MIVELICHCEDLSTRHKTQLAFHILYIGVILYVEAQIALVIIEVLDVGFPVWKHVPRVMSHLQRVIVTD